MTVRLSRRDTLLFTGAVAAANALPRVSAPAIAASLRTNDIDAIQSFITSPLVLNAIMLLRQSVASSGYAHRGVLSAMAMLGQLFRNWDG